MRFELMTSSLPRKRSTPELHWLLNGAEDEVRTRDPQLGRLMLYQLSYFRLFRFEGASSSSLLLVRILIYGSKLRCSLVAFLEPAPSKRKTIISYRGASSSSLLLARILIYGSKLRCSLVAFLESAPSKRKIHRSFGASLSMPLHVCVGREGFEPPKACASRFTVCPSWPLWYLPDSMLSYYIQ